MLCIIRTIYVVKELVLISNISVTIVLLPFVSLTLVRYFLSSLKLKFYPTLETKNLCLLEIRVRNVLIDTEIAIKMNSISSRICGKSNKYDIFVLVKLPCGLWRHTFWLIGSNVWDGASVFIFIPYRRRR